MKKPLSNTAELDEAAAAVIGMAARTIRIFAARLDAAYNSRERTEALRQFLLRSPRNQLHIALHDAGDLRRDFPRFIALLTAFNHNLAIYETGEEAKAVHDEFILADDLHFARRFHSDHARGEMVLHDTAAAQDLKRRFDEIWLVSTPAVFATTLGL
jgi:hypothetical protein